MRDLTRDIAELDALVSAGRYVEAVPLNLAICEEATVALEEATAVMVSLSAIARKVSVPDAQSSVTREDRVRGGEQDRRLAAVIRALHG